MLCRKNKDSAVASEYHLKGGFDCEKVKQAMSSIKKIPDPCNEPEMLEFIIDLHHQVS